MTNEVVVIHTLRKLPGLLIGTSEWQGKAGEVLNHMEFATWPEDLKMLEFAGYEIKEGPVNIPVIAAYHRVWRIREILGKEYAK